MTDSSNTTPEVTANTESKPVFMRHGKPWVAPQGFGGAIPRKPYVVAEDDYEAIVHYASYGMRERDIAAKLGWTHKLFTNRRNTHLEIQEALDEGRRIGRLRLNNISWDAINDKKDPARNQELARLHRIFKSEEADKAADSDENGGVGGFIVQIIPNNKAPDSE